MHSLFSINFRSSGNGAYVLIVHSLFLSSVSTFLGWIYFLCWTASIYPQVLQYCYFDMIGLRGILHHLFLNLNPFQDGVGRPPGTTHNGGISHQKLSEF